MIDKVLELRGIGKSFNGVTVLDNINIRLESGTVYGLAGENGAGKSTLMKIINGAYIADEGEIFVDGKKVAITSPQDAQDIGIGMVYQELGLLPDLNVAENIFISHLSENRAGYIKWKDIHSKSEALLRELEVAVRIRVIRRATRMDGCSDGAAILAVSVIGLTGSEFLIGRIDRDIRPTGRREDTLSISEFLIGPLAAADRDSMRVSVPSSVFAVTITSSEVEVDIRNIMAIEVIIDQSLGICRISGIGGARIDNRIDGDLAIELAVVVVS